MIKNILNFIFKKEENEFTCFGNYPFINKVVRAENDCFHCIKLIKCIKKTNKKGEEKNERS